MNNRIVLVRRQLCQAFAFSARLEARSVFRDPWRRHLPIGSARCGPMAVRRNSHCLKLTLLSLILGAAIAAAARDVAADEVKLYAEACQRDVGVAIQGFDCMTGSELPMTGTEGGTCAKPPYLDQAGCHAGSRIGQQITAAQFGVVYLCRKKQSGLAPDRFDDIAVIETNFTTGATCFFQKLDASIDGKHIPSPSVGGFWMKPSEMQDDQLACAQCHDSGPFIRTPYVMQAAEHIEAFKSKYRNRNYYWFGGNEFVDWNGKVFKVSLENDAKCSGACHIMGANNIDSTVGTSAFLGLGATGQDPTEHLEDSTHHNDIAYWMRPGLLAPNADSKAASVAVANCANSPATTLGCTLTPWPRYVQGAAKVRGHHPYGMERAPSTLSPAPAK
jgi:hypothetical protein